MADQARLVSPLRCLVYVGMARYVSAAAAVCIRCEVEYDAILFDLDHSVDVEGAVGNGRVVRGGLVMARGTSHPVGRVAVGFGIAAEIDRRIAVASVTAERSSPSGCGYRRFIWICLLVARAVAVDIGACPEYS